MYSQTFDFCLFMLISVASFLFVLISVPSYHIPSNLLEFVGVCWSLLVKVCFTQKMLVKLSHRHLSEPFSAPGLLFPVREHSYMTSDVFGGFLTYLPTLIRYFTT